MKARCHQFYEDLQYLLRRIAEDRDITILEMESDKDHIHLLVVGMLQARKHLLFKNGHVKIMGIIMIETSTLVSIFSMRGYV